MTSSAASSSNVTCPRPQSRCSTRSATTISSPPEQGRGELVAERVRVQRGERAVEVVRAQRLEDAVLRVLDHVDRDARMLRAEVGEHAEQVVRPRRIDAADPQLAAQEAGELLELGVEAVDLG